MNSYNQTPSVTSKKYISSPLSVFGQHLHPCGRRRMFLAIFIILITSLCLLWDNSSPSVELYSTSNIDSNGKSTNLPSNVSLYLYFDIRYQPMSVNTQFEIYYEKSLAEHRSLTLKSYSLLEFTMRKWSGRSSNITDNADTPFMYPMLAPITYIRYEPSVPQSSTPAPPRFSSCSSLLRRDAHEYTTIIRDSINFYDIPKYNMPWYFYTNQEGRRSYSSHPVGEETFTPSTPSGDRSLYHSTMPLCGRTLVRFLENPAPGVPKHFYYKKKGNRKKTRKANGGARLPQPTGLNATVERDDASILMKAKNLKEYYKEPVEHQSSVHRVVVLEGNNEQAVSKYGDDRCGGGRMRKSSLQFASVIATANTFFSRRIYIENCGASGREEKDIFIHARLIGEDRVLAAEVVPVSTDGGSASPSTVQYDVQFQVPDIPSSSPSGPCHPYYLEIKYVHFNGKSPNPLKPYTLGIVGIRTPKKQYKYNIQCDFQRHVYGSPILIEVVKGNATDKRSPNIETIPKDGSEIDANYTQNVGNASFLSANALPISVTNPNQCTRADHTEGQWVRFLHGSSRSDILAASHWCQSKDNSRFCSGNPVWLTDAAGYNSGMLWAPTGCAYTYWTPSQGPTESCVRHRGGRKGPGTVLLVGDSIIREHMLQFKLFNLSNANLVCVYKSHTIKGLNYTTEYAKSVVSQIIRDVIGTKATVFGTNLGIHHMMGDCSTAQWTEVVDLFASEWEDKVNRGVFRMNVPGNDTVSAQIQNTSINTFIIEKAIWSSSPTIQYSYKGMSHQRAVIWNHIAISRLRPLGFVYLNAFTPTYSRQEGTWDGLHYSSWIGAECTHMINPLSVMREYNGGVSDMLFTMLLNLICFG